MKRFDGQIGFYYEQEQEGLTRSGLENFWENSSEDVKQKVQKMVFFTQQKTVIENQRFHRSVEAEGIEAAGDMYLITPEALMSGSFVSNSDRSGCVITRQGAEILFGNYDVLGKRIKIGEKEYTIRGILDTKEIFCMVQGEEEKKYSYIRVEASKSSLSMIQSMLPDFVLEDMDSYGWIFEGNLYYGIGRFFLFFPAWLVLFAFAVKVKKILVFIAKFAAGWILLSLTFRFSDDYIPTTWSDFAFWTELFSKKGKMIFELVRHPWQIADSRMLQNFIGIVCAQMLVLILLNFVFGKKISH